MTYFYKTTSPVSQVHMDFFTEAHQCCYPGNRLSVLDNGDGTVTIKCAGEQIANLPADFVCLEVTESYGPTAATANLTIQAPVPTVELTVALPSGGTNSSSSVGVVG